MSGLSQRKDDGAWQATWTEGGRKRSRRFKTEAEGRAFLATLPAAQSPGRGRGRKPASRAQIIAKLANNFEVSESGCWLWTGNLTNAGYARVNWSQDGTPIPGGHRVVLHAIGQPVPSGLVVDHLCRERHCINPDHLDVVTQRENIHRSSIAVGGVNAAKTHCVRGHEFTAENTTVLVNPGGRKTITRACKECTRERSRRATAKYRAKRAGEVAA